VNSKERPSGRRNAMPKFGSGSYSRSKGRCELALQDGETPIYVGKKKKKKTKKKKKKKRRGGGVPSFKGWGCGGERERFSLQGHLPHTRKGAI